MPDGKVGGFDPILLRTVRVCAISMSLQMTDLRTVRWREEVTFSFPLQWCSYKTNIHDIHRLWNVAALPMIWTLSNRRKQVEAMNMEIFRYFAFQKVIWPLNEVFLLTFSAIACSHWWWAWLFPFCFKRNRIFTRIWMYCMKTTTMSWKYCFSPN